MVSDQDTDLTFFIIRLYSYSSHPVDEGRFAIVRCAGWDAVARQRQAGARVAGRKPGSRARTRKGVRNIRRRVSGARES